MVEKPQIEITIVVLPREKFSYCQMTLEALLENTKLPFKLIYVDGNSPRKTRDYLRTKLAGRPDTSLLRFDHYIGPMYARNIALKQVDTKYVAMVDNDVYLKPGWLEALYRCAQEEQAEAVVPLVTVGGPQSDIIHVSSGESGIKRNSKGASYFHNKQDWEWYKVTEVPEPLVRRQTELLENHCVLAHTEVIRAFGGFDDNQCNMVNNIDLSMLFMSQKAKTMFEPEAQVVYLLGPDVPTTWSDLPYWYLSWSEKWTRQYFKLMANKYQVDLDLSDDHHVTWWLGDQRRKYMLPLVNSIKSFFNRIHLPKAGWLVIKVLERAEVVFSYIVVEAVLHTKAGSKMPTPSFFTPYPKLWRNSEAATTAEVKKEPIEV